MTYFRFCEISGQFINTCVCARFHSRSVRVNSRPYCIDRLVSVNIGNPSRGTMSGSSALRPILVLFDSTPSDRYIVQKDRHSSII